MPNSVRKQTDITDEEKTIVLKRQGYRSISGYWLGTDIHNCDFHHVVNSGLGVKGVGYEFNLVAITREEHRCLHDGQPISMFNKVIYTNQQFKSLCKNHLKLNYINWKEENCKVKKGYSKEDYGVKRREDKL